MFTLDTCISILSCISPLVGIVCSSVMTVGIPAPVRDGSVAALKGKHQKPFGLCRLMLFLIFVTILEDVKEKSLCMLHKGVKD